MVPLQNDSFAMRGYFSGLTTELADIEAVFLDLDGTIYLGGDLIEGLQIF